MARISGVDIPNNKVIKIGLTSIYGIGRNTAEEILEKLKIDLNKRGNELTEQEIALIRKELETNRKVEGELRKDISVNIRRLMDLNTYRGIRHKKGLPVRGQKTKSNARTRKGSKKTVANKKSVKSLKS